MNVRTGLAVVLVVAWAGAAGACGPYYPDGYFYIGQECRALQVPQSSVHSVLERATGKTVHPKPVMGGPYPGGMWGRTVDADTEDLRMYLRSQDLDQEKVGGLVWEYKKMRDYIKVSTDGPPRYYGHVSSVFRSPLFREQNEDGDSYQFEKPQAGAVEEPPRLNLSNYNGLLNQLPSEFSLYVLGAGLYRVGEYQNAISIWKRLLELPPEQRYYRSTWAAFMIGKSYLQFDLEQAISFFEQTQALAREGFRDSLRLGSSSIGWIAYIEVHTGRMTEALHHYYEMWTTMEGPEQAVGRESLRSLTHRMIRTGKLEDAVVHDPLCARILMAGILTSRVDIRSITPVIDQLVDQGGIQVEEWAGQLAWTEYSNGRFDSAAEWVARAKPECPYAKWIHAKLLMRNGKIDESLMLLGELVPAFPVEDDLDEVFDGHLLEQSLSGSMVRGELGVLHVSREEYVDALEAFMSGGYWLDAAYLAERVLTMQEIQGFIKAHEGNPRFGEENLVCLREYTEALASPMDGLKYLLARRLFRAGQYKEAVTFFPESAWIRNLENSFDVSPLELRAQANEYIGHITEGRKAALPKRKRAEHLFAAAQMAKDKGLELMGTEGEPDWGYFGGQLGYGKGASIYRFASDRKMPHGCPEVLWKQLLPKASEQARVVRHAVKPEKRFHYRYVAAELMWEASRLLPDNDPMTARALYDAGRWLMDRDPEAADKYYKALVRRCRELPVGQKADELRWFPRKVTDADFEPLSYNHHGDT